VCIADEQKLSTRVTRNPSPRHRPSSASLVLLFLPETMNRLRNNLLNYFWNLPDITEIKIPEGANTTSTVKVSARLIYSMHESVDPFVSSIIDTTKYIN